MSPSRSICGKTPITRIMDIIVPRPRHTPIEEIVPSVERRPIRTPAAARIVPDVIMVGKAWLRVSVIACFIGISCLSSM